MMLLDILKNNSIYFKDKMKIIGIMLTWNNLVFFKYSLQQALDFCDEVWVVEGCHSKTYPWHSTDGTYEYLRGYKHPKLKFVDGGRIDGRYDEVQCFLRSTIPRKSKYWEPGNWVFQLDDDLFFFDKDLVKIRQAMRETKFPALEFNMRYFIYNFKLNFFQRSLDLCYRITDNFDKKFKMMGVGYPRYRNGTKYYTEFLKDVVVHHFTYVKTPERMEPRWVMSIEKWTEASKGRFKRWMNVDLSADFSQLKIELDRIRSGGGLNLYTGKYPEVLDGHPWKEIKDVRRVR